MKSLTAIVAAGLLFGCAGAPKPVQLDGYRVACTSEYFLNGADHSCRISKGGLWAVLNTGYLHKPDAARSHYSIEMPVKDEGLINAVNEVYCILRPQDCKSH